MEFPEKGCFNLTAAMVICLEALQNFVHALEQERPEAMEGSKVSYELADVLSIMMVGLDHIRPV